MPNLVKRNDFFFAKPSRGTNKLWDVPKARNSPLVVPNDAKRHRKVALSQETRALHPPRRRGLPGLLEGFGADEKSEIFGTPDDLKVHPRRHMVDKPVADKFNDMKGALGRKRNESTFLAFEPKIGDSLRFLEHIIVLGEHRSLRQGSPDVISTRSRARQVAAIDRSVHLLQKRVNSNAK